MTFFMAQVPFYILEVWYGFGHNLFVENIG